MTAIAKVFEVLRANVEGFAAINGVLCLFLGMVDDHTIVHYDIAEFVGSHRCCNIDMPSVVVGCWDWMKLLEQAGAG